MATNQPAPSSAAPSQGNGIAVAGMVLGILGLVLCWIPFVGGVCALVGIILGALGWSKANKNGKNKGMAIAGTVCGIVGLVIGAIFIFMTMVAVQGFAEYAKKGRKTEANLELRSIEMKIKLFHNDKGRLPASASMMPGPGGSACTGTGGRIPRQPRSAWDAAGWQEMGFHIDEDSLCSYQWTAKGQDGTAIAVCDLDCDGVVSTTTLEIKNLDGNLVATYLDPTPD